MIAIRVDCLLKQWVLWVKTIQDITLTSFHRITYYLTSINAFLAKSGVAQSGNPCPRLTDLCFCDKGVNSDHTVGASKPYID